jgi:methylglutaconyl-CoA hydratase
MISPYVVVAMGQRMANRYMITGEEFDAAEAYRIGFVHDICEDEDLAAKIGQMLAQIYTSGPKAILAVKELIPFIAQVPVVEDIVEETAQRLAELRATPEAQEGLSAFLEKRATSWSSPSPKASKRPARKKR